MATIKSYTDVSQSKKLAEFLPIESADMVYIWHTTSFDKDMPPMVLGDVPINKIYADTLPCWSLAVLLKCLSEIKPQVYTPVLFSSEDKWTLQFVKYGHGDICKVTCNNPVDACYELILKLYELKMLQL